MSKETLYTKEQQQAVFTRGHNVIVSAGAGSGKTKVLSGRAYQLIKEGMKLEELVMLTFTNAAAFNMREKVRELLLEDEELAPLADKVESSYITTFDALALSIVKRFHYLLEIDENISITDDSLVQVKKNAIIDEILDEYYAHPSSKFLSLISKYTLKNDNLIKKFLLQIDKHASLKINRKEYLNNYINTFYNQEKIESDINTFFNNIIEEIKNFSYSLNQLEIIEDVIRMQEKLGELIDCQTYDELQEKLINFRFPPFPRGLECDEEYKEYRKKITSGFLSSIKNYAKVGSKEDIIHRFMSTKDDVEVLIEIIIELDKRMEKYKKEYSIYTFSDIAYLAYTLLDHSLVKEEFTNKIKAIMIDEYQDTSDIQEAFIMKMANNNLFMVGDVKQSIYRFRNANCELFMDKYYRYQKAGNDFKYGEKIDFTFNFRSRQEVIEDINELFSSLMSDQFGGANYRVDHLTTAGQKSYLEGEGKTGENYYFEMNGYQSNDKTRTEAHLIAQDIIKKLNNYKLFNKKTKKSYKAGYNDFAILLDRATQFDVYKEVFEEYHIPLKVQSDEEIASSVSVRVLKNLLRCFKIILNHEDDPYFSTYYASIYRSFLYQGNDQELEKIILESKIKDTELYQKIEKIALEYKDDSLSKQVIALLHTFDFEHKLILIGDIEKNEKNIEYVLNSIISMENMGYTLDDFITYLDNLDEYDIKIKAAYSDDGSDAVRLLTIHKSKGLEYPIVYYAGLSVKFNLSDINSIFMTSLDYGIIFPVNDDKIPETMYHFLARMKELKDELSEKIRLLYVALTRAEEKMIAFYPLDYNPAYNIGSAKTFLDFLYLSSLNPARFKEVKLIENTVSESVDIEQESKDRLLIKEVQIPFVKKEKIYASNILVNNVDEEILSLGTRLHFILELINFNHPDLSFIEDEYELNWVNKFFTSKLYLDYKDYRAYHEYSYFDEENNYKGIIDLLLIGEDKAIIIDFKTANIDPKKYTNQLKTYATYVRKTFKKEVATYLYSIMNGNYIEVDVSK